MEMLKTIGLTVLIMIAIYLAVILSYILLPAVVFLFIFFVVKTIKDSEDKSKDW